MIFKTEKIGDFEIRYPTQTKTNVITNELEARFAELEPIICKNDIAKFGGIGYKENELGSTH